MEVSKDPILEYNPDAQETILAKYDLDGPGRLDEAVKILEDWLKTQKHFRKKDFPRRYLESTLISRKGSIERSKELLDKYCTMRTLTPQFFGIFDVSRDLGTSKQKITAIILPKQTKDHSRVFLFKAFKDGFDIPELFSYFKYNIVLSEYIKMHDWSDGMVSILDLSEINLVETLAKADMVLSKQASDIQMKGFGTRLINHHIITDSKMVGAVVTVLKQLVSDKIANRIIVHKTASELQNYLDKKMLPKDYGGEERSIRELQELWIKTLSSKEHMKCLEEMAEASTDESFRSSDKFNEDYAGMAGTFRVLKVD